MPLPSSPSALEGELGRLERELGRTKAPRAIRLLAIERRRVILALDAIKR